MAANNKTAKKQNNKTVSSKKNTQDKTAQYEECTATYCKAFVYAGVGLFFGFLAIAIGIAYDTHLNDNTFSQSSVGQLLDQVGALPYVEVAWVKTMGPVARGFKVAEQHVPVYAEQAYTVLHPYGLFLRDLSIVSWNTVKHGAAVSFELIHQKTPIVSDFIEQYVPGLPQKISDANVQMWTFLEGTAVQVYNSGYEFFSTRVFVGNLSPESLNHTLNHAADFASRANKWFHARIELFAKYE